jgi:hypothetical protein
LKDTMDPLGFQLILFIVKPLLKNYNISVSLKTLYAYHIINTTNIEFVMFYTLRT